VAIALFAVIAGLFLAYDMVVVAPRAAAYRAALQSLRPAQVRQVRLHTEDLRAGRTVVRERVLAPADVERFCRLLAAATGHRPNHPRGGWTCFAEIDTVEGAGLPVTRFEFAIHATDNDGVQLRLHSGGRRGGWSYGTLRNDDFGPFVEQLFHDGRPTPPHP
jgi:hypothetical protein